MDYKAISQELKTAILYSGRHDGAVKRISEITGLGIRTIYNYLDGDIKMNLDFIKAATLATDGDPEIKKHLEPEGWALAKKIRVVAPIGKIEKELGDISIEASSFHALVRAAAADGKISPNERASIKKQSMEVLQQMEEVMLMVESQS
jgi:hypothetical protein